jgi:Mor family transcriptional regulator
VSEDFITRLAAQVVRHPTFSSAIDRHPIFSPAIERTVAEVLEAVLREQYGGESLQVYVAKVALRQRQARADAIASERASGAPVKELARRHGLTVRRVQQILAARRAKGHEG